MAVKVPANTFRSPEPRRTAFQAAIRVCRFEERYPDIEAYSSRLRNAINNLERAGFLLPFDAEAMLKKNLTNAVSKGLVSKSALGTTGSH